MVWDGELRAREPEEDRQVDEEAEEEVIDGEGGSGAGSGGSSSSASSTSSTELDHGILRKILGVRHPIKHRRFRAGDRKMMVESGRAGNDGGDTTAEAAAYAEDFGYTSGWWKSDDGSLSCGYSSFRGRRATMEDFYDIKSSRVSDVPIFLFGIFDGHGGSRAAEYLKGHLFDNLLKHPEFMTNAKLAISETYQRTDAEFLEAERNNQRDDGSTASTAVLVGTHLYVANVGDSRAVISRAGKAIALSEDHKPNRSDERKRIENAGGVIMWAGTWRVGGVLAMSRAFGNRLLKQFVVAEPEIQEQVVEDDVEFLILASDGLWDVVSNEDAVSLVRMEEEPEAAARKLTETAYARGSADNITCIVVKFCHESPEVPVNTEEMPAPRSPPPEVTGSEEEASEVPVPESRKRELAEEVAMEHGLEAAGGEKGVNSHPADSCGNL